MSHPLTRFTVVGHSGTSSHIFNTNDKLFDIKLIDESVKGIFGQCKTVKRGREECSTLPSRYVMVHQNSPNVQVLSWLKDILFFINQQKTQGDLFSSDGLSLLIEYPDDTKVAFDC